MCYQLTGVIYAAAAASVAAVRNNASAHSSFASRQQIAVIDGFTRL
jgi:hypothetical protein